jgi:hypothetical protein
MRLCKVVLALGIIALVASPVFAQGRRGGGMGGFGQTRYDQLVSNASVQTELKMDDDQKKKADEAVKKVRDDLKDDIAKLGFGGRAGGGGGGNQATPEERAAATKKVNEATVKALKDGVLKDDQIKRLSQIRHQQMQLALFTDEDAQKALKLTDDQKSKIKTINDDLQKEVRDAFGGGGGGGKPNPEALTKIQTLRKEAMSNAQKALTDDQKKTLKDMLGEPFELQAGGRGGKPNKPRTDF